MKKIVVSILFAFSSSCFAQLDPLVDYRMGEIVSRNSSGTIIRSQSVLRKFQQTYPCPATGAKIGTCPGWAIDHVIPLACGGRDVVYNMQWLPATIKSSSDSDNKDRFERKVYGGHQMSKGCP
jgi:hypothetical protein